MEELDAAAEHLPHTSGEKTLLRLQMLPNIHSCRDGEMEIYLRADSGVHEDLMSCFQHKRVQNGSIMEGLTLWKNNVDKRFEGVEDCMICFSVIHGSNYSLPKKACRTCKKRFHSACLVSC